MKYKKIFLSSVFVAMLMLVSLQVIFVNHVRSDPTMHPGDADVGELWIKELNAICSYNQSEITAIAIAHANASDDWVLWENRTGNITVDWNTTIDDTHPEYHLRYSLVVYDVDDNNIELGNATYETTLSLNTSYRSTGTLIVAINFSGLPQSIKTRTLVCDISTYIRVNGTSNYAINFTNVATDRAVVGVDFETPRETPPFSTYKNEANTKLPHRYAWIKGWDSSSRFTNENDMLNTQTTFVVGNQSSSSSQQYNESWEIGNVSVRRNGPFGLLDYDWEVNEDSINWSVGPDGYVRGWVCVDYDVTGNEYLWPIKFFIYMKATESNEFFGQKFWMINSLSSSSGTRCFKVRAYNSTASGGDGIIDIGGTITAWTIFPFFKRENFDDCNYKIYVNDSVDQDTPTDLDEDFYWEASVAYFNATSASLPVSSSTQSGITTVKVDIADLLKNDDGYIETFSADRDSMRIEFKCTC